MGDPVIDQLLAQIERSQAPLPQSSNPIVGGIQRLQNFMGGPLYQGQTPQWPASVQNTWMGKNVLQPFTNWATQVAQQVSSPASLAGLLPIPGMKGRGLKGEAEGVSVLGAKALGKSPKGAWRSVLSKIKSVKAEDFGESFDDISNLYRGWLDKNGKAVNVGSHESSLENLGVDRMAAFYNYPEIASEYGLIRVIRRGGRTVAEIFGDPSDAQIRQLRTLEKSLEEGKGSFEFAITNPVTQKAEFVGTKVNQIRGAAQEMETNLAAAMASGKPLTNVNKLSFSGSGDAVSDAMIRSTR